MNPLRPVGLHFDFAHEEHFKKLDAERQAKILAEEEEREIAKRKSKSLLGTWGSQLTKIPEGQVLGLVELDFSDDEEEEACKKLSESTAKYRAEQEEKFRAEREERERKNKSQQINRLRYYHFELFSQFAAGDVPIENIRSIRKNSTMFIRYLQLLDVYDEYGDLAPKNGTRDENYEHLTTIYSLPNFLKEEHQTEQYEQYAIKKNQVAKYDPRVRLRPPNQMGIVEIEEEASAFTDESRNSFDRYTVYYINKNEKLLNPDELKVVRYLEEKMSIDDLGLNRENATHYLRIVKLADLALVWKTRITHRKFPLERSTYEIRTRILELLSPEMTTTEAYAMSLSSRKIANMDYVRKVSSWIPERIGFYAKFLIPQEFIRMIALSKRLNDKKPTVHALMAPTAAGKTTLAKKVFKNALDEDGELSGSLNPDNMKWIIKIHTSSRIILTNIQVHDEVVKGPLVHYKEEILRLPRFSIILDARLSSIEDFESNVVTASQSRNGKAIVKQIDVPLPLSMHRIIAHREPQGQAACVHPNGVISAFKESNQSKLGIINRIGNESLVEHYELFHSDDQGNLQIVAEKTIDTFHIFSNNLWNAFTSPLKDGEIEKQSNEIICSGNQKVLQWKNFPIQRALEFHSMGMTVSQGLAVIEKERILSEKYGEVNIQPFSGTWLNDYPQIKEHLDSEHLLHVRGVDEEGRGLLWQTNKFTSKLNPVYNPEAKGGFQMKLGYFIVPMNQVETLTTSSFSPSVFKEMTVTDISGEILGYRFFVHPEAYKHFQALHETRIPFVKPEQSEFIGTPTSSYRSWTVRHVVEEDNEIKGLPNSVPFIVKLGVAAPGDTSKLLAKEEVEKSVRMQMQFDEMVEKPDLLIFPECFGLVLKNIPNYPPAANITDVHPIDSGLIVREFPKEFLAGNCKIFSFSALMSMERVNVPGTCKLSPSGDDSLPLIYEIIEIAINKGLVKTPFEFVQRYLITSAIEALEPLMFEKGLSLALHAQNLCMVLNNDNTVLGVAIRDHGDIHKVKRYIETYSWFYRYHVFVKLLNVVTISDSVRLPAFKGAPTQIGHTKPLTERSVNYYLQQRFTKDSKTHLLGLQTMKHICITFAEFETLLAMLDKTYVTKLSRYFDLKKARFVKEDGTLPAVEPESTNELQLMLHNKQLHLAKN